MSKPKKLKVSKVLTLHKEFKELLVSNDVSFAVKFKISKSLKVVEDVVLRFEKQRESILKKHGEFDKNTGKVNFKSNKETELAAKDINSILEQNEEVTFNCDLKDFEDLKTEYPYIIIYEFL
jgi:hypothetical protein